MTVFTDLQAGLVDTDSDNGSVVVTRTPTGKIATETFTTHKGFSFVRTYHWDANDAYAGCTAWTAVGA